jgi:sulfur-carrier protein
MGHLDHRLTFPSATMPMPEVTVRYWAGARQVATVAAETCFASTVADVIAEITARRPALVAVLPSCSILVEGLAATPATPVAAGQTIEVLPPFAGG